MKLRKEQTPESITWIEYHMNSENGRKVIIPDKLEEGEEIPEHETVRICLRYLRMKEINEMQTDVYNIKAEMSGRKTGVVSSKFDYGLYTEKKIETAIVEWENVVDEDGNPAPVNVENIRLLPAWIGESLIEEIDDMNDLGTEISGK